ncbi:MAG: MurT ligase domain-containing protein [Acidimicrobiales bacterium]
MTTAPTSSSRPGRAQRLPLRARVAVAAGRLVAWSSRVVRFGTGSVIGGRVSLLIDRDLLEKLTTSREVVIVSATNGKTTTTKLLSSALGADRPVVSNWLGANMTPGIVAALATANATDTAILEVDERWVDSVLRATTANTVVLLNLSRDQLDRTQEVRKLADQWRRAFQATPPRTVIANADDPLVTWAALAAPFVVWVSTGQEWTADAAGCPACSGRIEFTSAGWSCTECDLQRPPINASVNNQSISLDDQTFVVKLALPGHVNRVNATFALAAARSLGANSARALDALDDVSEVAGRYRIATINGTSIRLLLAKNPAGWHEALELLEGPSTPLIIAINARIADGHDPSWLWDVAYERVGQRFVVAIGERRHDLSVRFRYGTINHVVAEDLDAALELIRQSPHFDPAQPIDIASNYTAFQEHLERVGGVL